ncbi:MAG: ribosome small subunit-dependent GTPase A [Eubacteriales bacterium]|nr:ribosome small subunit-dependent GTPase A [Eubacteriales bacterium]
MRLSGRIVKGIGGFYYVNVVDDGLYECRAKGIFRNRKMKPNVGDYVEIDVISQEEKTGNLAVIKPRKNQLIRPMVSNVDQAIVIFAVRDPDPDFHLLNRFLIYMNQQEVPVIICFNKMDLAKDGEKEFLEKMYENSGCELRFLSAINEEGIESLHDLLAGKTTVLAGPSGVGKSSTLNGLSNEKQMETGVISEKIRRGKHTTRHSELIYLGEETYMMDTPGFSSLYLENIEKEDLKYYFPEFEPYENQCRFNGCSHIHEPDCSVKQALEEGKIHSARYEDYCLFYEELAQIKKW